MIILYLRRMIYLSVGSLSAYIAAMAIAAAIKHFTISDLVIAIIFTILSSIYYYHFIQSLIYPNDYKRLTK